MRRPLAALLLFASRSLGSARASSATPSPDHGPPFPPTYAVPGESVLNAFYNLVELVSSTYPFTGGSRGGGSPGGRRAAAAANDDGEDAAPPAVGGVHDAGLSLFSRARAAARLASELLAERLSDAGGGAGDGAGAERHARRLVGGAPVLDAGSAPAALFCDVDINANLTAQRILLGDAIYDAARRRRRRLREQPAGSDAAAAAAAAAAVEPLWHDGLPRKLASRASAHDAAASASREGGPRGGRALHAAAAHHGTPAPPFTYPLGWPYVRFAVEEWCTLARFTPQVLAAVGLGDPKTLLIPDLFGFLDWSARFPAWFEWLTAFPACVSTFNRMAFFLQLHASWRRVSCATPPAANCSYADFPSAALPRVGSRSYYAGRDVDNRPFLTAEKLRIGRLLGPGVRDWSTCRVDTRRHFSFAAAAPAGPTHSPSVRAQFLGRDGNILLLDGVMVPTGEPLMAVPTVSALEYVLAHPQLTNFSCLLVRAGLAPFLALAPLYSDHLLAFVADGDRGGGANATTTGSGRRAPLACLCADVIGAPVPASACRAILRFLYNLFHSVTLFAPVDAAFARLPPGVLDYLLDPTNVDLARYVVLTHLLHGQTYLYDCSLADAIRAWRRLEQRTASNSIVTLSSLYDALVPQAGNWLGRRAQAAGSGGGGGGGGGGGDPGVEPDADAAHTPYEGRPAGSAPLGANSSGGDSGGEAPPVTGSSFGGRDDEPECDGGANVIRGGRSVQLLLHFNNQYNPSPYSARTLTTNIETTTGIVVSVGACVRGARCGSAGHGVGCPPDSPRGSHAYVVLA